MSSDSEEQISPPEEVTDVSLPESAEDAEPGLLDRRIGDRPLIVYLAMAAGIGVLALLLGIVWISATGGGEADQPICLDISSGDAERKILAGEVSRLDVLTDKTNPTGGLTLIQVILDNGDCAKLPEGADNRQALYEILGVTTHYNETADDRVQIDYTYRDVPAELLATSTPIPTETPEVTAVPTSETATASVEPVLTPTTTSDETTSVAAPIQSSTEVAVPSTDASGSPEATP